MESPAAPPRSAPRVLFLHGMNQRRQLRTAPEVEAMRAAGLDVDAPVQSLILKAGPDQWPMLLLYAAGHVLWLLGAALGHEWVPAQWRVRRRDRIPAWAADVYTVIVLRRWRWEMLLGYPRRHGGKKPDVVVCRSFSGAMVLKLMAAGHWAGPTVMLCPTFKHLIPDNVGETLKKKWQRRRGSVLEINTEQAVTAGAASGDSNLFEDVVSSLKAMPPAQRASVEVFHGTEDTVASLRLCKEVCTAVGGFRLHVAHGQGHELAATYDREEAIDAGLTPEGGECGDVPLVRAVHRVCAIGKAKPWPVKPVKQRRMSVA